MTLAGQETDPLAIYGAVTATAALLWGIGWSLYTWRRQFRTRIKADLTQELTRELDGSVNITGLVARIVNHSTHEVALDRVLLIRAKGKKVLDWSRSARGLVVGARNSKEFHFGMADALQGQIVRVSVWLATGKNVRSKTLNLADPKLLEF